MVCNCDRNTVDCSVGEVNSSELLVNMTTGTLEDFYPAVSIAIFMRYIRDPALSQHYTMIVQVLILFVLYVLLFSKLTPLF